MLKKKKVSRMDAHARFVRFVNASLFGTSFFFLLFKYKMNAVSTDAFILR